MTTVLRGQAAEQIKEQAAQANAKAEGAQPQGAGAPDAEQMAQEFNVMHPERSIRLRDRLLLVREYGYIEGLSLQPGIKAMLDALYGLFSRDSAPPSAAQVRDLFADYYVTLQWLMAQAITPYPESVEGLEAFSKDVRENARFVALLNDLEGDALNALWWEVNQGFFIRRFRERRLAELQSAPSATTPP